ncbi:MAG: protoheme IX farnesyltransferase [Phycisphaerales bacterium]|nr:protoheme IX farnesyltransferase [Phycisphaerales bacterium]
MNSAAIQLFDHHHAIYTSSIENAATITQSARILPTLSALAKVRLNALVLVTAGVGFIVALPTAPNWMLLLWTLLGTAASAASAAMFNQLLESRRDGLMRRTEMRPLPRQHIGRPVVFIMAVILGYAGWAILLWSVGWIPATLATGNVLVYAAIYTPLKPITSLNTLVGAVCGAIPPLVGWTAATGSLAPGAWVLAGILFVWQLPHFMALAWMYRVDYARGGFIMLPVVDPTGRITAQTMVLTSLILVPLGLLATIYGIAGWWFALAALVLGVWITLESFRFLLDRTDGRARRVFLTSIIYLPLLLFVLVLDRGSVSPEAALRNAPVFIPAEPKAPQ